MCELFEQAILVKNPLRKTIFGATLNLSNVASGKLRQTPDVQPVFKFEFTENAALELDRRQITEAFA